MMEEHKRGSPISPTLGSAIAKKCRIYSQNAVVEAAYSPQICEQLSAPAATQPTSVSAFST